MLKVTCRRSKDLKVIQKNAGVTGVFGRNEVDVLEDFQAAQGDVFEIADGGGNDL